MKAEEAGGVIHCFGYGVEQARQYLNKGYYLGIGGVLSFTNGKKLKEVVGFAPLEQLLLETDCPYLSPVPYRGKRNSSLYLTYVVQEIARIKNIDYETVVAVTNENAKKLFFKDRKFD
jgi:TatD DNase family protein